MSEGRTCRNCGAPITAPRADSAYCMRPACRRAYSAAYEATKRIRHDRMTSPIPQPARSLPRIGEMVADENGSRVECHICGEFYGSLGRHTVRTHGVSGDEYRARYGLTRKQSLDSPTVQASNRARAIAMNTRERLTQAGNKAFSGRPRGTNARVAERVLRHQEGVARQ